MIQRGTIEVAAQALVDAAQPLKVILFGSHARGEAGPDSDLDFLVVEAAVESSAAEMVRLRRALGRLPVPADVLVVSQPDVDEWGHLPGTALYWALKEGITLHEAAG